MSKKPKVDQKESPKVEIKGKQAKVDLKQSLPQEVKSKQSTVDQKQQVTKQTKVDPKESQQSTKNQPKVEQRESQKLPSMNKLMDQKESQDEQKEEDLQESEPLDDPIDLDGLDEVQSIIDEEEQSPVKEISVKLSQQSRKSNTRLASIKLQESQKLSEAKSEKPKTQTNFQKNLEKANKLAQKFIPQDVKDNSQSIAQAQTPSIQSQVVIEVQRVEPVVKKQKVAPMEQFRNFMPLNSSTIIQSHAENAIAEMVGKLIKGDEDVFVDVDFPCGENSLFGRDYEILEAEQRAERENTLKEILDQVHHTILQQIQWIDMEETLEEAHKLQFCDMSDGNSFYTKSIVQGYLQDKEFLNALALVCSNKMLFNYLCCLDLKQYPENKLYLFRMYKNKSQRYTVAVDAMIPTLSVDSCVPTPCFSRTEISNEIWVSMIEKAYAKLNGGFAKISGMDLRQTICDLTGLEPEFIVIDKPENVNVSNLNEFLRLCKNNGSIVGFMSRQKSEINNQINDKLRNMSKLDSPPESDRLYIFQDVLEGGKQYTISDPWFQGPTLIKNTTNKGIYNITFSSLMTIFNCIVVLKDFPDEWRGVRLDINLSPSYGVPSSSNVGWVNNTQYMIQCGSGVPGDMQDVPFLFRMQDIKGVQSTPGNVTGMMLCCAGEKENKITTYNQNNIMYLSKPNGALCFGQRVRDNYSHSIQKLGKKYYSLIPFTSQKGETVGTYVSMEIYFATRPSQISFKFKPTDAQLLSSCLGEPLETECVYINQQFERIMRDKVLTTQLSTYQINSDEKLLALVPGMAKHIILINPNVQLGQVVHQVVGGKDIIQLDDKLKFIQDNIIYEALLGLNLKVESDQVLIDQVQKDLEGVYCFNNFNMGDEGLKVILPVIIAEHNITDLRLAGNNLTDTSITLVCYEVEKAYHHELLSIDFSDNRITKGDTIIEFITIMKNLKFVNLTNNVSIPQTSLLKIKAILDKRL